MAGLGKSAVIVTADEGVYHQVEMHLRGQGFKHFRWEVSNPTTDFLPKADLFVMVKSNFGDSDRNCFDTISASKKIAVVTHSSRSRDEKLEELGHSVLYKQVGLNKPIILLT